MAADSPSPMPIWATVNNSALGQQQLVLANACCVPVKKGDFRVLCCSIQQMIVHWMKVMQPRCLYICDGSQEDADMVLEKLAQRGTLMKIAGREKSFVCRRDLRDAVIGEADDREVRVCTEEDEKTGNCDEKEYLGKSIAAADLDAQLRRRLPGCMSGRMMYVLPFCLGPIGSPLAKHGIEITDSPYEVMQMYKKSRISQQVFDLIKTNSDSQFLKAVHSIGCPRPEQRPNAGHWPCNPEQRIQAIMVKQSLTVNFGSGCGGEYIFDLARRLSFGQDALAERMAIIAATDPDGAENFFSVVLPEGIGRRNLASLDSPESWKVQLVSDKNAFLEFNNNGQLVAINPEKTFHGNGRTVKYGSNSNLHEMLAKNDNTIFTNISKTGDRISWEGINMNESEDNEEAHPRWEDPRGVPISAIVFGGEGTPSVVEAKDWEEGVLGGEQENLGNASVKPSLQHWLDLEKPERKMPKVFHMRLLQTDGDGRLRWKGFGDDMKLVKWMCKRIRNVDGTGEVREKNSLSMDHLTNLAEAGSLVEEEKEVNVKQLLTNDETNFLKESTFPEPENIVPEIQLIPEEDLDAEDGSKSPSSKKRSFFGNCFVRRNKSKSLLVKNMQELTAPEVLTTELRNDHLTNLPDEEIINYVEKKISAETGGTLSASSSNPMALLTQDGGGVEAEKKGESNDDLIWISRTPDADAVAVETTTSQGCFSSWRRSQQKETNKNTSLQGDVEKVEEVAKNESVTLIPLEVEVSNIKNYSEQHLTQEQKVTRHPHRVTCFGKRREEENDTGNNTVQEKVEVEEMEKITVTVEGDQNQDAAVDQKMEKIAGITTNCVDVSHIKSLKSGSTVQNLKQSKEGTKTLSTSKKQCFSFPMCAGSKSKAPEADFAGVSREATAEVQEQSCNAQNNSEVEEEVEQVHGDLPEFSHVKSLKSGGTMQYLAQSKELENAMTTNCFSYPMCAGMKIQNLSQEFKGVSQEVEDKITTGTAHTAGQLQEDKLSNASLSVGCYPVKRRSSHKNLNPFLEADSKDAEIFSYQFPPPVKLVQSASELEVSHVKSLRSAPTVQNLENSKEILKTATNCLTFPFCGGVKSKSFKEDLALEEEERDINQPEIGEEEEEKEGVPNLQTLESEVEHIIQSASNALHLQLLKDTATMDKSKSAEEAKEEVKKVDSGVLEIGDLIIYTKVNKADLEKIEGHPNSNTFWHAGKDLDAGKEVASNETICHQDQEQQSVDMQQDRGCFGLLSCNRSKKRQKQGNVTISVNGAQQDDSEITFSRGFLIEPAANIIELMDKETTSQMMQRMGVTGEAEGVHVETSGNAVTEETERQFPKKVIRMVDTVLAITEQTATGGTASDDPTDSGDNSLCTASTFMKDNEAGNDDNDDSTQKPAADDDKDDSNNTEKPDGNDDNGDAGKSADEDNGDAGKSADDDNDDAGKSADDDNGDAGKSADDDNGDAGKSADDDNGDAGKSADDDSGDAGKSADDDSEDAGKSDEDVEDAKDNCKDGDLNIQENERVSAETNSPSKPTYESVDLFKEVPTIEAQSFLEVDAPTNSQPENYSLDTKTEETTVDFIHMASERLMDVQLGGPRIRSKPTDLEVRAEIRSLIRHQSERRCCEDHGTLDPTTVDTTMESTCCTASTNKERSSVNNLLDKLELSNILRSETTEMGELEMTEETAGTSGRRPATEGSRPPQITDQDFSVDESKSAAGSTQIRLVEPKPKPQAGYLNIRAKDAAINSQTEVNKPDIGKLAKEATTTTIILPATNGATLSINTKDEDAERLRNLFT